MSHVEGNGQVWGSFLGVCSFPGCLSWKHVLVTGCSAAQGAFRGDPRRSLS